MDHYESIRTHIANVANIGETLKHDTDSRNGEMLEKLASFLAYDFGIMAGREGYGYIGDFFPRDNLQSLYRQGWEEGVEKARNHFIHD